MAELGIRADAQQDLEALGQHLLGQNALDPGPGGIFGGVGMMVS